MILWSGGVDSTYLVYWHLTHGRRFDTVSVDAGQLHLKIMREAIARMALWRAFINADLNADLTRTARELARPEVMATTHPAYGLAPLHGGFQQIMAWIVGVMRVYNPAKHSHVEMAYVMGDDMIGYMHQIAETFRALGIIQYSAPVEVYFPMSRTRKHDAYKQLERVTIRSRKEGVDRISLLDLTWVCELPTPKGHCGDCAACKREVQVRADLGMAPRPMVALDHTNVRLAALTPAGDRNNARFEGDRFNRMMALEVAYPASDYPQLHSEEEVEHGADRDEELISELPYNSGKTISIDRDEHEGVLVTDDDPVASQS